MYPSFVYLNSIEMAINNERDDGILALEYFLRFEIWDTLLKMKNN